MLKNSDIFNDFCLSYSSGKQIKIFFTDWVNRFEVNIGSKLMTEWFSLT